MKDLPTVAFGVPTIEAPLARVGVPSMNSKAADDFPDHRYEASEAPGARAECENSVRKLKSLKDDYFHNWIENF